MKTLKYIGTILAFTLLSTQLYTQSCSTGTILINSQGELNDFVTNFGTCDSIVPGSKLIIDDTANDITDLSPLSNLTYVNWLEIYRTDITSLAGLENIDQATMAKCVIIDNPLLTDISQLTGIQPSAGDWNFSGSPLLTDLTGIHNNTVFGTSLTLRNLGITDLDDISGLTRIDAYFTLEDNANLSDISGLSNLTNFGAGTNGGFNIRNNPNLNDCSSICALVKNLLPTRPQVIVDIQGNIGQCIDEATIISTCPRTPCNYNFSNLVLGSQFSVNSFQVTYGPCDSLGATLVIADTNNNITDLSQLSTLLYSGGIIVDGNDNLTSLAGLENLEVISSGVIRISDNPILTDISQLSNIGPFSSRLEFRNNPVLSDLSIAQNFTRVGRLIVDDMDGLSNLNDFSTIDTIYSEYRIANNANLSDISLMGTFEFGYVFGPKTFIVENNSALADCSTICPIVKIRLPEIDEITTTIQSNLSSCMDEAAILTNCGRTACNQFSILLETNGEVQNFQKQYGPCDSISVNLEIDGKGFNEIISLEPLSGLEYIGNNLIIKDCNELSSLAGLENISQPSINVIQISNNDILRDVSQLSGIGPDVTNLSFNNNTVLSDLSGIENIQNLERLTILLNGELYNLDAFSNLNDITTQIIITDNSKLNSVAGLSGTTYGSGNNLIFILDDNPMLFDCTPLCGLVNNFSSLTFNTKTIDDNLGPCFDEMTLTSTCCTHPDYTALETFYTALNGDNWGDNSGWLLDCDPCGIASGTSWSGISCNASNRVTSIDMPNNLLSGDLPSEIFAMPNLTELNLGEADLTGTFPEEFCSSNIRIFNVSNCPNLSGTIPSCVADRTNLISFSISGGSLSGPLPQFDGSNTSLIQIMLDNNNLTGPIPFTWSDLPSVTVIETHNNQLSGFYDPALSNLCSGGYTNAMISNGNNFDAPWSAFCGIGEGASPCGSGYVEIPNKNFELALIDLGIDTDNVQNNCVALSDIINITQLDISSREVTNITGINAFKSLVTLIVDDNFLGLSDYKLKNNLELVYVKGGN